MRTRDAKNCLGLFDRLDPDGLRLGAAWGTDG